MADTQVVISISDGETAADAAAAVLKDSDLADPMRSASSRSTGRARSKRTRPARTASVYKGAGIGFILGLLGPVGVGLGMA